MDLSELKAAVARDRKRVEDLDRVAGLLDVFVDSAGVPVTVDAGPAQIVVTVDVSALQGFATGGIVRGGGGIVGERGIEPFQPLPQEMKTWIGDVCADAFKTSDVAAAPEGPIAFTREMQDSVDGANVIRTCDAPSPEPEMGKPTSEPARAAQTVHDLPEAPAPEPVTGPITDDERAIVQEMLDAGATGKEIGARLNRDPRQLGGVIGALRSGPRKRVLTPPARKPDPVEAPEPAPEAPAAAVEPVAKVAPQADAPPFAGEMSEDARAAARWDDHIASVPETKLFDRALDLDLMTCLSEGLSAKDFASTRELTSAEVAARFLQLMGEAPRTLKNQGLCIAAIRRAIASKDAA